MGSITETRTAVSPEDEIEESSELCLLAVVRGVPSRHRISGAAITLGRSDEADLVIADPDVSRLHAKLVHDTALGIEDLESFNGTFVAGQRLLPGERRTLRAGDVIQIGGATILVQRADEDERRVLANGTTSASMSEIRAIAERVANSMLSVLFVGETGVGKEVMAELVHQRSPRAARPFLRLNCAALSEPLLESELFGHERGAFTGAHQGKPGLLEVASGGTVFLDEVTELPITLQAKLLRVFEAREVMPVGALAPRPIDVRFVCATNRRIEDEIAEHRFRDDLYYRLNGITLEIPPLRRRLGEIESLANQFLAQACASAGGPPPRWSPAALAAMCGYRWPGNIRELKNVVERAAVVNACGSDGLVGVEHLPPEIVAGATTHTDEEEQLKSQLGDLERRRIVEALEASAGNQSRAAKLLGVARNTLIARMKAFGLTARRRS
jgi:transcriptional regulator with PAS, ATPase and Fis domain